MLVMNMCFYEPRKGHWIVDKVNWFLRRQRQMATRTRTVPLHQVSARDIRGQAGQQKEVTGAQLALQKTADERGLQGNGKQRRRIGTQTGARAVSVGYFHFLVRAFSS